MAGEELIGLGQLLRREAGEELLRHRELDGALRSVEHEVGDRHVHRLGNLPEQQDRDVAAAGFELRQVALRHAGIARQQAPRHAALGADAPDPVAQRLEIGRRRRVLGRFSFGVLRHRLLHVGACNLRPCMHYNAY